MAGISDEDVQKVRNATDIVSLFADRVVMQQRGRDMWCCCPFHEEKTPSCKVDPATQQFYCFGCHEHGDVFSYVMKTEEISFPDAVRRLAERAGIEIHETGGRPGVPQSYKERLRGICRETAAFYHMQLMRGKSPEAAAARSYLGGRGLGGDVAKRWGLGFAPGRNALVRHLRGKGYAAQEMVDANVAVAREGAAVRDRFYGRAMFPICDDAGVPIAFGGRIIGAGEPKYLNSQDTPLFHKSNVLYGLDRAKKSVTSTGTAIVVEGYTDVIALHEAGIDNAVATLGTALTTQHIRAIARHAARKVVYLFDGDEAGQRATDRALQFIDATMTPEAGRARVELLACTLPDGLDPADFVAQRGADELRAHLEDARPLVAFGIERHLARFDLGSAEGRTAAFADCIALLAPIKDSLLAKDYAVDIAGRLRFREDEALRRLAALEPPRRFAGRQHDGGGSAQAAVAPQKEAPALGKQERNRRRFEAEFLGLLAHEPALIAGQVGALAEVRWHVGLHARIAEALLDCADGARSAAEVSAAVSAAVPEASRVLVAGASSAMPAPSYAAYLAEELALGDLSDEIDECRAQLAHPEDLSPDELEILFQSVASLQRDLARRTERHRGAAHP